MTNNTNTPPDPAADSGGDRFTVVAQLVGLTATLPCSSFATPDALVRRFCADAVNRAVEATRTPEEARIAAAATKPDPAGFRNHSAGFTRYRGFCGLQVIGADDPMVSGFDDGYVFMDHLNERGWRPLASEGDWPYVVWMHSPAREDAPEAICRYLEADLTVWIFDDHEAARLFYRSIKDAS